MEEKNHKEIADQKDETHTITFKKSSMWKVGTFLFLGLFLLSFFNVIDMAESGTGNGNVAAPTVPSPTPSQVKVSVTDADPILGNPDAEIMIVEFSDFQCPFCARAASGALAEFKESSYFKDGEVSLVYKHLPLNSIHPQAQKAAEASTCAQNQGKFWEYHDLLFANQHALDTTSLKAYASQLGLDTTEFNNCLDNGEAADKVRADLGEATAAGGRGTPYFVLVNSDGDTVPVSGAVPWANFEAAISQLS